MAPERIRGRLAFLGNIAPRQGTKDITDEAREAFAAYRGLGKDIINDLIDLASERKQTIADLVATYKKMAVERDEWMARHMDASLQRDAYREMLDAASKPPRPAEYEAPRDPDYVLRVRGVGRIDGEPRAFLVSLSERPTDDEIRAFHDYIRSWRVA